MSQIIEKMSAVQQKAIALLADGSNVTDAAQQCEIARKTLSGWVNANEEFKTALKDAQAEIFSDEIRRIKSKTKKAIDVLFDSLENPNLRIRLTAASKLLTIVGIQTSIAESEKPAPIIFPPAIISQNCATCAVKIEARYFEELANL
jgi:transposase-like protein